MSNLLNCLVGIGDNSFDSIYEHSERTKSLPSKTKKRGVAKVFFFQKAYSTIELARQTINEEEILFYKFTKRLSIKLQKNIFYRCKQCLNRV